jgi:hypothetical protein
VPSEDHSREGAARLGSGCEGRHSEDHHQFSKKKTMNTTSNTNLSSELNNRSHHHQSEQRQPEGAVAPERKDNRNGNGNLPPIDSEIRKQNRTLPTTKVQGVGNVVGNAILISSPLCCIVR